MRGGVGDLLGAHMSIAGGLSLALERGRAVGCSVVQLFLKNQVQWQGRALTDTEAREFKQAQVATGIRLAFAHATYLINLASPVEPEWRRSVNAFHDELERAEALGLPFVVIHPGSHKGSGLEAGIARIVAALDDLCERTPGYRVRICLENTAGAGNTVGAKFEELGAILGQARCPERLGVCLDTCHLFAAGYDIRTRACYATTMAAFERAVGAKRLLAFHLNDAKQGLGSGLDRHEHIGQGGIGLAGFRLLLTDRRFARLPMVLETPKEGDADVKNLARLRRLRRRSSARTSGRACSTTI